MTDDRAGVLTDREVVDGTVEQRLSETNELLVKTSRGDGHGSAGKRTSCRMNLAKIRARPTVLEVVLHVVT